MNLSRPLEGKRVLVTGGTGSLGQVLVRRLLQGEMGQPERVIVYSRDEAKQHYMRLEYRHLAQATEEVIYRRPEDVLDFRIGDVRDYQSLSGVLREAQIIFNAAALKQVPTCEYFPFEAVLTNVVGAQNIVRAVQSHRIPVECVVGISTDKACKPVNVMGMTKAIQERVIVQANMLCETTRFVCVRYGNVLASRGSVVPLFQEQIRAGGPVTLTVPEMTRFLLSLDAAVDTVFAAVREALPGETFIPRVLSTRMDDLAAVLIGERSVDTVVTGVRPGEKTHEILISEEEAHRTVSRSEEYFAILPILPELREPSGAHTPLDGEYSSADWVMDRPTLTHLLQTNGLLEAK